MKQGKAEKANRLAQLIIEKPIKKNSTIIQKIKAEMKHHLSRKHVCTKAYTTVHLEGENINKNTPFMVEEIAKTLKANK